VWIRGRNGAGKSTLLAALLAAADLPPERVLALPQELTLDAAHADLAQLRALPTDVRGRVLQLVHALGVEPEVLLRTASPSPGEARKLRLALGLGRHVWLAALDEPTNHLDLPSVLRLESALAAFPGALLLVTHDLRLGERVTQRALEL
jgi:ABC-type cobalamin/Fe3+-siderophores transport system ATPase subunit